MAKSNFIIAHVNIENDVYSQLNKQCEKIGMKRSQFIRQAIKEKLQR